MHDRRAKLPGNRRSFLKGAAGVSLGLPLTSHFRVAAASEQPAPEQTSPQRNYTPPYRLRGRRMIFTNWSYISPGTFGWHDAQGKRWALSEDKAIGELNFRPVDQASGIRLTVQTAELSEPFLGPREGWEARGVNLTTIIQEGNLYRGWGTAYKDLNTPNVCYYESQNGTDWDRPQLGRVEFEGSTKNNIILAEAGNHTVFLDAAAPPDERFKMVVGDRANGLNGYLSSDGIHWNKLPEPICADTNDTVNMVYFDADAGKYVLYNRKVYHERRAIGRSESADFRSFPFPELMLEASPDLRPADDLYTNGKTVIPGAPDHHLLFPMIYHRDNDLASTGLLSSYDGRIWHWLSTESIFPAPTGAWRHGWMLANPNLVELPGGAFAISYTMVNMPHKYPRAQFKTATGWAIWPKGRMIALEARERGEFTTHAFFPPGRKLRINAITAPDGQILVESSGGKDREFSHCKPLSGDLYKAPVMWGDQDDLGHPEGKDLSLRFRLEKAKLFGLEFT